MATKTLTLKFPYPDSKPPVYKSKAIKIDGGLHTEQLSNAYKTTRDVAVELRSELEPFLKKARERVCELIREANGLKKSLREVKEELRIAREELRLTKDALIVANTKNLHPALLLLEEDPNEWCKAEVDTEPY
ncbi:hypothetical protein B0T26DRAFT_51088 [Lasiosphaeria miniovina]|uniref:Uncharacterized protein n=1 Tax=Lasiosphaeria miniovina TaxID=1954250 RepID=A0AA40BH09_9PEZI|nr:uncharacterized protein B0T26DRAFT_51088 [Lasiosphaeria miniovina]KAK0734068.1 hypothetical protein B0T26DRAFT_51088 [Lasiosphaeria miniovina]